MAAVPSRMLPASAPVVGRLMLALPVLVAKNVTVARTVFVLAGTELVPSVKKAATAGRVLEVATPHRKMTSSVAPMKMYGFRRPQRVIV